MANIEKIKYEGFDFALALQPTGKQPLDSRTIVKSLPEVPSDFTSSAAYEGMMVTLLDANGDHKVYVLQNTLEEILAGAKLRWNEVGKETDLSNYYTKSQVDAKVKDAIDAIPDVDLTDYATKTYVNTKVAEVKDASYAYATNEAATAAGNVKNASYAYASKEAGSAQASSYAYAGKVASDAQAASYAYAEAKFNALLGDGKLIDTVDTIKEISYWLDNNPNDAVELTLSLAELTEKVTDNEKVVATSINNINSKLTWGVI